jgi:lysophospholipase L1-like esterase
VFLTPLHNQYTGRGEYVKSDYDNNGILTENTFPLNDGSGNNGAPLKDFIKAIKEVAELYAIKVIDTHAISGIQPLIAANSTAYTQDGLHLNAAGGELLASVIYPLLELL